MGLSSINDHSLFLYSVSLIKYNVFYILFQK